MMTTVAIFYGAMVAYCSMFYINPMDSYMSILIYPRNNLFGTSEQWDNFCFKKLFSLIKN